MGSFSGMDAQMLEASFIQFHNLIAEYKNVADFAKRNALEFYGDLPGDAYGMSNLSQRLENIEIMLNSNKTIQELEEDIASGHFINVDIENLSKYLVTHEFGHTLQAVIMGPGLFNAPNANIAKRSLHAEAMKHRNEILRASKAYDSGIKLNKASTYNKYISEYGQEKPVEFFAELFTHAKLSSNPNPIGKGILDWLKGKGL